MEETIKQRIEALEGQRAQLVQMLQQSRQQSAQFEANILQHDGAIAALQGLLKPAATPEAGEGAEAMTAGAA